LRRDAGRGSDSIESRGRDAVPVDLGF
jgi:hypothetical protein